VGIFESHGKYLIIDLESLSLSLLISVNSNAKNCARPAFNCEPRGSSFWGCWLSLSCFKLCFIFVIV
jgi:hypothetical protein